MIRLGVVTGMRSEADCLAQDRSPPLLFCAGASAERAYRGALSLAEQGATHLVSFGIAGGLDPDRLPGDLILPDAVIDGDGRGYTTDAALNGALAAILHPATTAPLYGSPTVVAGYADKTALHRKFGCVAVDMESHAVAAAAAERRLPFIVVRVMADHAARPFPRAVQGSLTPDGRQRGGLVAARLLLRPWELPAVIGLGRDYRVAMRVLGGVAAPALLGLARRGMGI
ncbi:MAG: squalene--hopene cyclase [Alphaproteobacteria bacterium]